MDSKDWTSLIVVMVVVALVVNFVSNSFITGQTIKVQTNLTGPVVYTKSEIDSKLSNIRARSCDADGVCEVGERINSSVLTLSSSFGAIKLEGDVTLTKIGSSRGVIFETNPLGSLMITPGSGSAKLNGDLTLARVGGFGGATLDVSNEGVLYIIPSSGYVKLKSNLSITSLVGVGNAYACLSTEGLFYRSSKPCA